MQKKSIAFEAETKSIEDQTQTQSPIEKKHSKAYYKMLHTYSTLTAPSKAEPISINCCATPIIAERLFGCKLKQKQQLSNEIQSFLKSRQAKRNLSLEQTKRQQISRKESQKQVMVEDQDDEGFEIGGKDEIDQVVQMGAKYLGGFMKGFLPGLSLNKLNNKK